MDAYQLIGEKLRYNQWANQALVGWLKEQPDHRMNEKVISGHPSLNKLLHHMMEAETYYLSILKGTDGEYFNQLPTEELFDKLLAVDLELLNWFQAQDPAICDKEIKLKRSPFEERYSHATILSHVINHNTFHRGQVIAARHQLGILKPPKTDYYWMFAEELLQRKK